MRNIILYLEVKMLAAIVGVTGTLLGIILGFVLGRIGG